MNFAFRSHVRANEDQLSVLRRFLTHFCQTFNGVMQYK